MTDSPRREVPAGASLSPPVAAPALSPLVQLLPTGYRDIQPFQKGRGWHANGPARRRREPGDGSVVFPAIAAHESQLRGTDADERQEREDSEHHLPGGPRAPPATSSPSIAAIPVPPSAPRRPSRGDSNQQSGGARTASPRFRTRAVAAAAATATASSSYCNGPPDSMGAASETPVDRANGGEEDAAAPDPDVVAKLWQEYAERTKPKTLDREAYHRKMQHKYSEIKAMRERVTRLESELAETQRERDEARDVAVRSAQHSLVAKPKDSESNEEIGVSQQTSSQPALVTHKSGLTALQQQLTPEEVSYREKAFKLERSLAATKDSMTESHTRLTQQHEKDREIISALTAKLLLEQEASQTLARQLHEANAAFKSAADTLVSTQIALEREQAHKTLVLEQIQQQTNELLSDHRRKELQNRVKTVIRNMGKEALRQKMEALHTRALVAEQNMRRAQLQVSNLTVECEAQQLQLEQILSSSALKYHSLAADGGVPGILQRATPLFYGARVITGQFLMVQILYEDERAALAPQSRHDLTASADSFGNEPFRMHFVCYEAQTAQDDFLTFQLRDIRRLVPDHDNYLARFADRKRERLMELAEILFTRIHAGYKNGHLVITEIPMTASQSFTRGKNDNNERREVSLLRTTRRLAIRELGGSFRALDSGVLAEILVNEVYEASTSEVWWLEIRALVLDTNGTQECGDDCCGTELSMAVDYQKLRGVCSHLGSYRPSESAAASRRSDADENEMFGIHEELLEPLLSKLTLTMNRREADNQTESESSVKLILEIHDTSAALPRDEDGSSSPQLESTGTSSPGNKDIKPSPEIRGEQALWNRDDPAQSVLDHRCIVRVGDNFYCARIQEVWDVELMLDITMEDPETQSKFHLVIPESDIVAITRHLFAGGAVDEDYTSHVKNGLPSALHAPVCKLLKKHLQPVATDQTGSAGTISIASLMNGISPPPPSSVSDVPESTLSGINNSVSDKWKALKPLGSNFSEHHIADAAAELSERESSGVYAASPLQRIRRGCRIRSSQQPDTARYAVVDIWSGFRSFPGFVLEITPIFDHNTVGAITNSPTSMVEADSTRRVITLQPPEAAFEALEARANLDPLVE